MISRDLLIRALYMLAMAFIATFIRPITLVVSLLQFFHIAIKKNPQRTLLNFGHSLAQYNYEIISFLTFNSEDVPFPFAPWPR